MRTDRYTKEERKTYNQQWYEKNKEIVCLKRRVENVDDETHEKMKKSGILNYQNHKESVLQYKKVYYKNNKEQIKERKKEYRKNNKEQIKEKSKIYYEKNKENVLNKNKKYREENKEDIKNYIKQWRINNKDKQAEYLRDKRKNNSLFKLSFNIRNLIRLSFKNNGYSKKCKTHKILGCSFIEFKEHLEKQFEPWMNWENHGKYNGEFNHGWDIDHIIPISSATTESEVIQLNHYTNLQPLCSKVNRYVKRNNPEYN